MAISETHNRHDVPSTRFEFTGYRVWHADRGGQDKVSDFHISSLFAKQIYQGGGGLALYYDEQLKTHEYTPSIPTQFEYLKSERQWLLVESKGSKIAFLRYSP